MPYVIYNHTKKLTPKFWKSIPLIQIIEKNKKLEQITRPKKVKKQKKHMCGKDLENNKIEGLIIKAKGIRFCQRCGHEFRN